MKFINIICLLVFILFGCQSNTSFNYSNPFEINYEDIIITSTRSPNTKFKIERFLS